VARGGSSIGGESGHADGAADAAPFCPHPLGLDDCSGSSVAPGGYCPLEMGIQSACLPCGPLDGGQSCFEIGALVRGTMYTYIQLYNVDTASEFVYDKDGTLVAVLYWGALEVAHPWMCTAGPANFDASEAKSLLPVQGSGDRPGMCAGAAGPSP
jgi:hypothetical protein